jgi:coproporphyrinogen III oxidase-like Fe-S oxidoreductase
VSLGLQALDDEALRFLGRAHDVSEGLAALDTAQARVRPRQLRPDLCPARSVASPIGRPSWRRAIGFGTEHLSLYQLTIEPGTRFATLAAAGELIIPDGDAGRRPVRGDARDHRAAGPAGL